MSEKELLALLVLQYTPHLGDGSIKRLIQKFGSAQEVLLQKKSTLLAIDGIGEHKLSAFGKEEYYAFAKAELEYMSNDGIHAVSYLQDEYPLRLKHCIDSPVILFSRGKINWNNPRILSIVGTRKITTYGEDFIKKFIAEIAPLNPLIISGFAYGVDITTHKACIAHGLQNVGVLAHGLNQIYPKVHARYVNEVERNGGFVTDFWSSSTFVHTNFLQRNRIIAGLSEATIVIESAAKGGSLVTAEFANGYNREVFAVPGRTNDKQSIGCNNLIKQSRAHLLTNAADIVYMLNWKLEEKTKPVIQKQLFVELTDDEKLVWRFLSNNGKELLDSIALHCKMPTFKVASVLLQMELKGVVRPLPGKLFEII
ncbi:DNA-processing protein DprA [Dokdonia sp. Hel_I_53]|uniref:DNA-processing protein DprA n=1 Tax=Dokdonia sp. Hel_I_53 TaxID=1566287 RepID=UPI00119A536C|nr:DNA-processing protein DprA [Dokdonia sp. Hel_I_53]TVZ52742.1 DNA processing protein [Dokdonia sp. Hel_I_53]